MSRCHICLICVKSFGSCSELKRHWTEHFIGTYGDCEDCTKKEACHDRDKADLVVEEMVKVEDNMYDGEEKIQEEQGTDLPRREGSEVADPLVDGEEEEDEGDAVSEESFEDSRSSKVWVGNWDDEPAAEDASEREEKSVPKENSIKMNKRKRKRSTPANDEFQETITLVKKPRIKKLGGNGENESSVVLDLAANQCSKCSFTTSSKQQLSRHFNETHRGMVYKQCPHCDHASQNVSHLRLHIKGRHDRAKDFQCGECPYASLESHALEAHKKAVHFKQKDVVCEVDGCDFVTTAKANLRLHVRRVHTKGPKTKACRECDYRHMTSAGVQRHYREVHLKVRFNCELCEFQTTRKTLLNKHVRMKHQ